MSLHEGHVGSAHDVSLIPERYHTAVWRGWGMWTLLEGWSSPGHRGTQGTEAPRWHGMKHIQWVAGCPRVGRSWGQERG